MSEEEPRFWEDVQTLFADAMELAPTARGLLLNARCAGRPRLRAEVDSLMVAHERSDRFLEVAVEAGPNEDDPEGIRDERGRVIGRFRLLEKIAEGGMGVVYRAERVEGEFSQRVAVKLIDAALRSPDTLRRFRAERQILATLNHPHIVTLLDGGVTSDGQAYLVMECVDGVPITHYCSSHRLPLEDRLRLFRDVCAAVQHAHQHGIVHRDLKPANILVTAERMPKVLDFGIAKLLDRPQDADRTTTGAPRPLTPNYASPEQLRGLPVTTASDIYALGVLSYELITGVRPYELSDKTFEEILAMVVDRDPHRPSAAGAADDSIPYDRRRLKGDLDAIVLKAMSREPERRYGSAQELSEDIARHLARRPILAVEPSFGYVARRLAARHKAVFLSMAIALLAIVAALILAIWQARIATAERDRAQLEATKVGRVWGFLTSLFASGVSTSTDGAKLTVQDFLENGVARVDKELVGQPELQATMLATLGLVYTELSQYDRAAPLLERSLALREKHLGKNAKDVAETLWELGALKIGSSDYDAARRYLERAVRIREEALGPEHPLMAEVLAELGNALGYLGKYEEGKAVLARAIAIEENGGGPRLVYWLTYLSNLEVALDNVEGARRLLERALDVEVRHEGRHTTRVDETLMFLGSLERNQEAFARAHALFEEALAIDLQGYGPDHQRVLSTLGRMGDLYEAMGDHPRARELLDRAILGTEQRLGPTHHGLAAPLSSYGRLLIAEGKPAQALIVFERALRVRERALGSQRHAEVATNLVEIALARALLEGSRAAEPTIRHALEIQREVLVAGHRALVPTLTALGEMLADGPSPGTALPLLKEAVEIAQAKLPKGHSKRLRAEAALRRLQGAVVNREPSPPTRLPPNAQSGPPDPVPDA